MSDKQNSTAIDYHDDNRVLRYLLHTVKGLSPVSGGVLGDALEVEYETAETEARPESKLGFDTEN